MGVLQTTVDDDERRDHEEQARIEVLAVTEPEGVGGREWG